MKGSHVFGLLLAGLVLGQCGPGGDLTVVDPPVPRDSMGLIAADDTIQLPPDTSGMIDTPDSSITAAPLDTLYTQSGSYFPIDRYRRWRYEAILISVNDVTLVEDTTITYLEYYREKDTIIAGIEYALLGRGLSIRIQDGRYYQHHFSPEENRHSEWLFLDESAGIGQRWRSDTIRLEDHPMLGPAYQYDIHQVVGRGDTLTIAGTTYDEIITITRDQYTKLGSMDFENVVARSTFYYASGVGLVRKAWRGMNMVYQENLIDAE